VQNWGLNPAVFTVSCECQDNSTWKRGRRWESLCATPTGEGGPAGRACTAEDCPCPCGIPKMQSSYQEPTCMDSLSTPARPRKCHAMRRAWRVRRVQAVSPPHCTSKMWSDMHIVRGPLRSLLLRAARSSKKSILPVPRHNTSVFKEGHCARITHDSSLTPGERTMASQSRPQLIPSGFGSLAVRSGLPHDASTGSLSESVRITDVLAGPY
jgi:hypothetical protein